MEKNQKNNVIVVRVAEIIRLLIKKLWIMILVGVIFAAGGYGYGVVTTPTPMYSATTKLYVTGADAEVPSTPSLNLGQQVLGSYIEILRSRPVLEQVIEDLNLNMSYAELRSCVSQYTPEGTCMLEISVAYPEPELSKKIVDDLVTVSADRAKEIMGCRIPVVYEEAYLPTEPYNSAGNNSYKYLLLGGVAGVALTGFIILVGYFASTKFNNPNKVTDRLHLKTLGVIPNNAAKNVSYGEAAYQNFSSRMLFAKTDAKIIDFISATGKENKYEFLQKTAQSFAAAGKKVLLMDTNLTNPEWGAGESADNSQKGLEDYLTGKAQLQEIIAKKEEIDCIYCTQAVVNAVELLEGKEFEKLLEELKAEYDYILLDTAPMAYVPDALCTVENTDAVVLVLSAKFSRIRQAKEIITAMEEREVPILGVVLKDMDIHKGGKYFSKEFGKYFGVYKN